MTRYISRRSLVLSSALAAVACALPARAEDAEAGVELTDDLSRGEIFQKFVIDPLKISGGAQSLAIPSSFQFPKDVLYDCKVGANHICETDPSKPRTKPMLFGVDISHHTDAGFSFSQLREQQVHFIQIKASQGAGFRDGKFASFWKRAGALDGNSKVFRGPYHFLAASADGKKQADWFLKILDQAGGLKSDDMAPGMDLEWDVYTSTGNKDHWEGKGAQYIIDNALACLERISEKTGRTPILYTGKYWFGPKTVPIDRFKEFAKYPLWVFDYNPKRKIEEKPLLPDNSITPSLWQFSDSAHVPATYSGKVDASAFYGTEAEFKKVFQFT
jgi:lysozyme